MTSPSLGRSALLTAATAGATALTAALAAGLTGAPAQAHGLAGAGLAGAELAGGALHPLLGADHLLLLISVGACAAARSPRMLLWAAAGALLGGVLGAAGASLPAAEVLAALAIPLVALPLMGRHQRQGGRISPALEGALVAAALAVHALLHGQEAAAGAAAPIWWLGATATALLVSGSSALLLGRLTPARLRWIAGGLAALGGLLALGPAAALLTA